MLHRIIKAVTILASSLLPSCTKLCHCGRILDAATVSRASPSYTRLVKRRARPMRAYRDANLVLYINNDIKSTLQINDENSACPSETTTSSLSLNKRTRSNTCYVAPVITKHNSYVEMYTLYSHWTVLHWTGRMLKWDLDVMSDVMMPKLKDSFHQNRNRGKN